MTEPLSHTLGSDTSHEAPAPLPLAYKLVVCFLFLLALEAVAELIAWRVSRPAVATISYDPFAPNVPVVIIAIATGLVIGTLMLLRSVWGRLFGQAALLLHALFLIRELTVQNPEIWVYLEAGGRVRLLLTLAIDAVVVLWLGSREAERVFDR